MSSEIRVLHWNIHSWLDPDTGLSNLDAVTDLIRVTDPDLVSLVEVDETWAETSQLAELAARCDLNWVFAPAFEYGLEGPTGGFGNAILSRFPIQSVTQRELTWPPTIYNRTEPSEPRTVALARVLTSPGTTIEIGSTHLPREDPRARDRALDRLRDITAALQDPWMICGDFNTPATWIGDSPLVSVPASHEGT
jgi:endonuclease/exonuclease/phosphatase family metal-dependent hydrolase